MLMIEKMAWNTFKKTGNINIFLEYKKIRDIEENIGEVNGNNKN